MAHKMAHFGSEWPKNQKLQLRFRQTCANASWSARHGHGNTGKWKYSLASEHEPGCRLRPGLSRFSSGRRGRASPKQSPKSPKSNESQFKTTPPPPPLRTPNSKFPHPPALRASALTPACGQPLRQPKRERDVDPDFHRGDGVGPPVIPPPPPPVIPAKAGIHAAPTRHSGPPPVIPANAGIHVPKRITVQDTLPRP